VIVGTQGKTLMVARFKNASCGHDGHEAVLYQSHDGHSWKPVKKSNCDKGGDYRFMVPQDKGAKYKVDVPGGKNGERTHRMQPLV